MTPDPADTALLTQLHLELATLKQSLERAEREADRLRGLWPRAELQQLRLDLAEQVAAREHASRHYDALRTSTVAQLPGVVFGVARRMQPALRLWRLTRRIAGAVRRLPRTAALRRQRRADRAAIEASPLFDEAWYRAHAMNGKPGDAVPHYLWLGCAAGHDPHPLFDSGWYALRHPGLGLANPFADYLRRGMAVDEDPHPLFDAMLYCSQAPEAAGRALLHHTAHAKQGAPSPVTLFDPVDYPEGLAHWTRAGAAADRDPHALFATRWYRHAHLAGKAGVNPLAHWVREGAAAGLPPNPFGLHPGPARLPTPSRPVASVIVRRSQKAMDTTRCLLSVAQHSDGVPFEVILAGDGLAPAWLEHGRVAPDLAAAAAMARGQYLVFLGSATVAHAGWLAALVETADADAAVGMVGAKLLGAEGAVRSVGMTVSETGEVVGTGEGDDPGLPRHHWTHPAVAVDPAAMLVRREAFTGLHDLYELGAFAAADLAFAARAGGWRVVVQPTSVVTCLQAPAAAAPDDWERFAERWAGALSAPAEAPPFVLVLAGAVPGPEDSPVGRALRRLLEQGWRVALHPLDSEPPQAAVSPWERSGVEVLRSPVLFEDWLADAGPELDEVWSFRAPADVPEAALLLRTGAAIKQVQPGMAAS